MKPQVSVILPTYNRAATLPRAMQSVLAQTFKEIELLVVDDGSTDDTVEVVGSIGDPRLRYIRRNVRGGAAAARNTGIASAQASLLAFQDSDDEWVAHKLEKQVQLLAACASEVGLTYCSVLRRDGKGTCEIPDASKNHPVRDGDVRLVIPRRNLVPPTAWLVRRECFDRVGMFDESLHALEDWEWMIRFSREFHVKWLDELLLVAFESSDSLSLDHARLVQGIKGIIGKHGEFLRAEAPSSLASLYLRAAVRNCLQHKLAAGRADMLRGISIYPWDARLWGALLISFAGVRSVEVAWRAARRTRVFA